MSGRTIEQRLKFDHGLPIGQSLVCFTLGDLERLALVEIGTRGEVWYFIKPGDGDMYLSWTRVIGDKSHIGKGAVRVWPARDVEFMRRFDGEPLARVPVKINA